jgi:hypothetical protein
MTLVVAPSLTPESYNYGVVAPVLPEVVAPSLTTESYNRTGAYFACCSSSLTQYNARSVRYVVAPSTPESYNFFADGAATPAV